MLGLSSRQAMERKPAVAVVFHHIGPYHHTRLNAAADRLSVTGIEWSAKAMTRGALRLRLHGITRFRSSPEATDHLPGSAELRCAFWSALEQTNPDVVAVNGWNNFGSLIAANCCLRRRIPMVVMSESSRQDNLVPGGRKPSSGESSVCTLPHSSAGSVTSSIGGTWNAARTGAYRIRCGR